MKNEAIRYMSACPAPVQTQEDIDARLEAQKRNYKKKRLVTVGTLIRQLKKFDADLPVCLADWNEQHQDDNNEFAGIVSKRNGRFYSTEDDCFGEYIAIGV